MTDSTARKKVPLPPGYVVPRPQQPPPLRRRDAKSATGVDVVSGMVSAPDPIIVSPQAPVIQAKAASSDPIARAAAFREAMATLSDDEDKTTAFQVPEELLRRSRTGTPGPAFEEEKSPDSGAITAPPPAEGSAESSEVKLGVPGVPKNLDVHSYADIEFEAPEATFGVLAQEDEHSGEFTRINMAGELEALVPAVEKHEATRTVVRRRLDPPKTNTASAVLWVVIGVLSAAGAILASLMAQS